MTRRLTAIIGREGDGYVALCPEFDIASQGDTVELARDNLREAMELFFEAAPPEEVERRLGGEVYISRQHQRMPIFDEAKERIIPWIEPSDTERSSAT